MTLRVHGHIDVVCDDCGTTLHTETARPILAAAHAETLGWAGVRGRRGMYCPACVGGGC